jgi:hypothetical protein
MKRLITASLALTALVAALSNVAVADQAPTNTVPVTAPAAQGRLAQDTTGISRAAVPPATPVDKSGIDRSFHPDYSRALTVDQMTAAWNAEIDRVFETPITGGG